MTLYTSLNEELDAMDKAGTRKAFRYLSTPMDTEVMMENIGKVMVLSSNNYLGLADHPALASASLAAI